MPATEGSGFIGSLRFRYGLVVLGLLGFAGFLLWDDHEAHILDALPLVLVLGVCLGMHLFMHGGHGGHGGNGGPRQGGSKGGDA